MASTEISLFSLDDSDHKKDKSPNALRTISEASEMLDVPQHVLRFWETKFSQIKPLKRNGGRRFYRPQDLDVLQQIKHLLYSQGYTIKGAKKAVDDFIHARADRAVTSNEWLAAIPPANVNDNYRAEEPDLLAELAQALTAPEETTVIAMPAVELPVHQPARAFPQEALASMRHELTALRDGLRTLLPAIPVAAH